MTPKNLKIKHFKAASEGMGWSELRINAIGRAIWDLGITPGGDIVGVEKRKIVDAARDPDSPLHREFTWNDALAAESWRLDQASRLCRRICVVFEDAEGSKIETRAFHPIRMEPAGAEKEEIEDAEENVGGGQDPVERRIMPFTGILESENYSDQVVQEYKTQFIRLHKKYRHYVKLIDGFKQFESLFQWADRMSSDPPTEDAADEAAE